MTKDCIWNAGGLNKESSSNDQFPVLIPSSWSSPPVQSILRTPQELHKNSARIPSDFFRHPWSVAYLIKNITDKGN